MTPRSKSFSQFFKLRQALIPLSTIQWTYEEGKSAYVYMDVYVFGFRVARFQHR
jgi:hypothetical protein